MPSPASERDRFDKERPRIEVQHKVPRPNWTVRQSAIGARTLGLSKLARGGSADWCTSHIRSVPYLRGRPQGSHRVLRGHRRTATDSRTTTRDQVEAAYDGREHFAGWWWRFPPGHGV